MGEESTSRKAEFEPSPSRELLARMRQRLWRGVELGGAAIIGAAMSPAPLYALPAPLVYLRDVEPGVIQDMRYATPDNFTGAIVPGYGAPECILTREAAKALQQVQADVKGSGLSLKVYDCYRPREAIQAFVDWAARPEGSKDLRRFHPRIARDKLFELGYIAAVSGHSRADTVDLTLVPDPAPPTEAFDPAAAYGDCTEPLGKREPDNSVDMGTGFDCFDPKSNTASPELTAQQRKWRRMLLRAMTRRGFRNYDREWWHFTYGAGLGPSYSFSITPRQDRAS
jgi:D-alanyl-D-alanine dipeptidase